MQGTISQFDKEKRTGTIQDFDGASYFFTLSEWKGETLPKIGVVVEFEGKLEHACNLSPLEILVIAENAQQPSPPVHHRSVVQSKSVRIHGRRTSVRLEPEMWDALHEIGRREDCTVHDLCTAVYDLKAPDSSFTASLRVFMVDYFRSTGQTNKYVLQVQKRISDVHKTKSGVHR